MQGARSGEGARDDASDLGMDRVADLRREYRDAVEQALREWRETLVPLGIDYTVVETDKPMAHALRAYLRKRERRRLKWPRHRRAAARWPRTSLCALTASPTSAGTGTRPSRSASAGRLSSPHWSAAIPPDARWPSRVRATFSGQTLKRGYPTIHG